MVLWRSLHVFFLNRSADIFVLCLSRTTSHPKPFPCKITLRSQESAELIKAGTSML